MKQFNIDGPITATENGDFLYKSDVHLVLLKKKNSIERDIEGLSMITDEDYVKRMTREYKDRIRLINTIIEDLGIK